MSGPRKAKPKATKKLPKIESIDGVHIHRGHLYLNPEETPQNPEMVPILEQPSLRDLAKREDLDARTRARLAPYLSANDNDESGPMTASSMGLPEAELRDALCFWSWSLYHMIQALGGDEALSEKWVGEALKKGGSKVSFKRAMQGGSAAVLRMTGYKNPSEAKKHLALRLAPGLAKTQNEALFKGKLEHEFHRIEVLGRAYYRAMELGRANRDAFAMARATTFFKKLLGSLFYKQHVDVVDVAEVAFLSATPPSELWPSFQFAEPMLEAARVIGRLHRFQPTELGGDVLRTMVSIAELEPNRAKRTRGEEIALRLHDNLVTLIPREQFVPAARDAIRQGKTLTIQPVPTWQKAS